MIALEVPSEKSGDVIRTSLYSFLQNSTKPFALGCKLRATGLCFELMVSPFGLQRFPLVIGIEALFLILVTSSSWQGCFFLLAPRYLLFAQELLVILCLLASAVVSFVAVREFWQLVGPLPVS